MKMRFAILLLAATLGSLRADDPPAPPVPPKGIIILKAVAGYPAADRWFVAIQWVDKDSGYVIDQAGNKLPFTNDGVGRIIYFDQLYYAEIDHNPYWMDWRSVVKSREVVVPPVPAAVLHPGDSSRLTDEQAVLQNAIDLYPNGADLVQPLVDTLKDEIAKLASGLVLQNGAWVSSKDAAPEVVPVVGETEAPVTFTTNDGKRFVNARVTVTATGLSVLTDDGGASVAFDRLPDDISPFPPAVKDRIADWRAKNQSTPSASTAGSSTGWWEWVKGIYGHVVDSVKGYFSTSSPPPADASTNAAPAAPGH
jgi:hypothetical protein